MKPRNHNGRTVFASRPNALRSLPAFTLIELLVVVSIIALLGAILLPSLQSARAQAKAVQCAANTRHVGQSLSIYLADSGGYYPPSYVYPTNDRGAWSLTEQDTGHSYGYLHWSHFLYSNGKVSAKAFQCPNFKNGGAPRTNPGPTAQDWEGGQVDQNGDTNPNSLTDKQAPRMAYAANAAIMPRNKFTPDLSGGYRRNVIVRENQIRRTGDTILATEYLESWKALGIPQGAGVLLKSHRPVNVFWHVGSGGNEYTSPDNAPGFIYGLPQDQRTYGVVPLRQLREKVNILDYTSGIPQINAVGRSHPGGDKTYGGTANFLFCDGHSERMTALESVKKRKWGDRYYSLSGENQVMNMIPVN